MTSEEPVAPPDSARALGPSEALVTLVKFGDFGCRYCASSRMPVQELVLRLESVRMFWRHFPDAELHPGADLAAEASEAAAEQGAFWPFHDALLLHQRPFDVDFLSNLAGELGLDAKRVHQALTERRFRPAVEADQRAGRKFGVTGTPTFFIDRERVDAPWSELRTLLPAAVARAE